jgi:hypothetical protein
LSQPGCHPPWIEHGQPRWRRLPSSGGHRDCLQGLQGQQGHLRPPYRAERTGATQRTPHKCDLAASLAGRFDDRARGKSVYVGLRGLPRSRTPRRASGTGTGLGPLRVLPRRAGRLRGRSVNSASHSASGAIMTTSQTAARRSCGIALPSFSLSIRARASSSVLATVLQPVTTFPS